jgi:hypothetical protein
LLAIVPWGPIKGNDKLLLEQDDLNYGYLTRRPVKYKPWEDKGEEKKAELDHHHSHFILVRRPCRPLIPPSIS